MRRTKQLISFLPVFVLLIAADQLTKAAAVKLDGQPAVLIPGVLEFRYLENAGAAFGMLENRQLIFIILAFLFLGAACLIILRLPSGRKYDPLRMITVFMMSGAAGNLIDRIRTGYVRDFIYFRLIDFPVFNLADIYVTVPACILFILLLTRYKDDSFDFLWTLKR